MTRVPQQILRLATLLIGVLATSVALAVATVDVTYTGPQAKIDETTIQLFDSNGPVKSDPKYPNRYSNVTEGKIDVDVFVGGKQVGVRQTVTVAKGPHELRVDSVTGKVNVIALSPKASPNTLFPDVQLAVVGATVGPGVVTDKPPTIGVFPTTDTSLLTGPSRVTTTSANLVFNLLKDGLPSCVWDFGFMEGHRSTSTEVPVGTDSGWAYWIIAPNGFTGVSTPLGANASLKTTYNLFNLDWAVPYLLKDPPSSSYWGVPTLGYQYSETKYDGMISAMLIPGVSSTTNQKVKESNLRGGYGVRGQYTASNQVWVSGGVGLDLIYYWGNYNGSQDNVCAVCSPGNQSYSVSNSGSKSGLTFGARADAAVGFPVSQDVDIVVLGTYRYDHAVLTLVNNVTPTDPAPHLSTGDRNWASIEFGVRVKFNAL